MKFAIPVVKWINRDPVWYGSKQRVGSRVKRSQFKFSRSHESCWVALHKLPTPQAHCGEWNVGIFMYAALDTIEEIRGWNSGEEIGALFMQMLFRQQMCVESTWGKGHNKLIYYSIYIASFLPVEPRATNKWQNNLNTLKQFQYRRRLGNLSIAI